MTRLPALLLAVFALGAVACDEPDPKSTSKTDCEQTTNADGDGDDGGGAEGVCDGYARPCYSLVYESDCWTQRGCWYDYNYGGCTGEEWKCEELTDGYDCVDQRGCDWYPAEEPAAAPAECAGEDPSGGAGAGAPGDGGGGAGATPAAGGGGAAGPGGPPAP